MKPSEGRSRVIIEDVTPQIDGGRHPAKRIVGDRVNVSAVIYADGHDLLAARILFRHRDDRVWYSAPMVHAGNDIWEAHFTASRIGEWTYTVQAWIDHFNTWVHDLHKRIEAQGTTPAAHGTNLNEPTPSESVSDQPRPDAAVQLLPPRKQPPLQTRSIGDVAARRPAASESDVALAFRTGAYLLDQASARAREQGARDLKGAADTLRFLAAKNAPFYNFPIDDDTVELASRYPDVSYATTYAKELKLWVDREKARFSTWYELFPRSLGANGTHGSLRDVIRELPSVAAMGFDVLYLPPISPIGTAYRKGKNNATSAGLGDVGSPWAIGNREGGHTALLNELGSFGDFDRLIVEAQKHGIELALDIAFQCSPDHPWVKRHPEWFQIRPDGSIQYAENPPKKYQDIYPLNFESSAWHSLWQELAAVFLFWVERGVRIFRVDNPHTKALPFWEWCIAEVHSTHPDVLFLAEAFTRPKVMYGLAKMGFSQSYTYFSWRTEKQELTDYMTEITTDPVAQYFRPNLWPNTPDILPGFLQTGGRAAFVQRAILSATLGASYGIYGPAFELCEHEPAKPGSEEYLNSEKYELRRWDREAPHSIAPLIAHLNRLRRAHRALQTNDTLRFHTVSNGNILCYSKRAGDDVLLMAVNLDPFAAQAGTVTLSPNEFDLPLEGSYMVEDLLTGRTFTWEGAANWVVLDTDATPAHILRLSPRHLSQHTAGESTED